MVVTIAVCGFLSALSLLLLLSLAYAVNDGEAIDDRFHLPTGRESAATLRERGLKAVEDALKEPPSSRVRGISEDDHWRFVAHAYALPRSDVGQPSSARDAVLTRTVDRRHPGGLGRTREPVSALQDAVGKQRPHLSPKIPA